MFKYHYKLIYHIEIIWKTRFLVNLKANYFYWKPNCRAWRQNCRGLGTVWQGLGHTMRGHFIHVPPPSMCMVEWIWGGGLFHQILYDVGKNLTLSKGMFFSFFLIFFTPKICMVLCAKIPNFCKKRKINFDLKRRVFYSFKLFWHINSTVKNPKNCFGNSAGKMIFDRGGGRKLL